MSDGLVIGFVVLAVVADIPVWFWQASSSTRTRPCVSHSTSGVAFSFFTHLSRWCQTCASTANTSWCVRPTRSPAPYRMSPPPLPTPISPNSIPNRTLHPQSPSSHLSPHSHCNSCYSIICVIIIIIIIIIAEMGVFNVAGYLKEERRRWPVITASPRGQHSK